MDYVIGYRHLLVNGIYIDLGPVPQWNSSPRRVVAIFFYQHVHIWNDLPHHNIPSRLYFTMIYSSGSIVSISSYEDHRGKDFGNARSGGNDRGGNDRGGNRWNRVKEEDAAVDWSKSLPRNERLEKYEENKFQTYKIRNNIFINA